MSFAIRHSTNLTVGLLSKHRTRCGLCFFPQPSLRRGGVEDNDDDDDKYEEEEEEAMIMIMMNIRNKETMLNK